MINTKVCERCWEDDEQSMKICEHCISDLVLNILLNVATLIRVERISGHFFCPYGDRVIKSKDDVPENCPYVLEHTVSD